MENYGSFRVPPVRGREPPRRESEKPCHSAASHQASIGASTPVVEGCHQTLVSHPFRRNGVISLLASSLLLKRILFPSQSSFPGTRRAIAPSDSHSMYL